MKVCAFLVSQRKAKAGAKPEEREKDPIRGRAQTLGKEKTFTSIKKGRSQHRLSILDLTQSLIAGKSRAISSNLTLNRDGKTREKEEVSESNSSIGERQEGNQCQITCLKHPENSLSYEISVVKGKESEKREALSR